MFDRGIIKETKGKQIPLLTPYPKFSESTTQSFLNRSTSPLELY